MKHNSIALLRSILAEPGISQLDIFDSGAGTRGGFQ